MGSPEQSYARQRAEAWCAEWVREEGKKLVLTSPSRGVVREGVELEIRNAQHMAAEAMQGRIVRMLMTDYGMAPAEMLSIIRLETGVVIDGSDLPPGPPRDE